MKKKKFISSFMCFAVALSGIVTFNNYNSLEVKAYGEDWGPDSIKLVEVSNDYIYITHKNNVTKKYLRGDVNKDDVVNATDVIKIAAYVQDKKGFKDWDQSYIADVNADARKNITDVTALAAHIKGKKKLDKPVYRQLAPKIQK